ncbi:hypothetical protein KHP62_15265 [Rhodobacteraceae bacterium NNCM2]|nr:hypothetical protein [Coraliihabitans acroporae]
MQWDVALYDLVAPYILRGAPLGPIHAAIAAIHVQEFNEAVSDEAVSIRGTARFTGTAGGFFDPSTGTFGVNAQNTEGHPRDDDGRRDPWIDLRDTSVAFSLTAPRIASQIASSGAGSLDATDDADTIGLLDGLDPNPGNTQPSDYPSTEFTLDMVITGAVLRPPKLKGAELLPDGRLIPIEGDDRVTLTLPRFKLRLSQGSNIGDPLDISMTSFGASGLDDPGDLSVAELIRMDPPYAFIGDSRQVGIGFKSAVLDLSTQSTPAAVLDQFGFDESWTGLYLPEIRLFVAPNGLEDFAVSVGASNLLIGWGAQGGITGDFALTVIDQGGDLTFGARFVDPQGRSYGITFTAPSLATASVPPQSRLIIDIGGGRPPYSATVDQGGGPVAGLVHEVTLAGVTSREIVVNISDSAGVPNQQQIVITAYHHQPQIVVTRGADQDAVIQNQSTTRQGQPVDLPAVYIASQTSTHVTLGLRPSRGQAVWTPASTSPEEDGPNTATFALGPDETLDISVTVTQPADAQDPLEAYFHFDRPSVGSNNFDGYVDNPIHSNTEPAIDQGPNSGWTGGGPVIENYRGILDAVPPGSTIEIFGTASHEGDSSSQKTRHNYRLSQNRALALRRLIEEEYPSEFTFSIDPEAPVGTLSDAEIQALPWFQEWEQHTTDRNFYWLATAELPMIAPPATVTTATLHRPPSDPDEITVVPENPPADPAPPDWFRSIAIKVRIVQNTFVALEVSGEVDFQTAAEEQIRRGKVAAGEPDTPSELPMGTIGQNTADGIVAYRILIQIDDAAQTWTVSGSLAADPADIDGLALTGNLPGQPPVAPSLARNMLGMTTAMAPVLATTAPSDPLNGDIGALVLSGAALGIPFAMTQIGWLNVERVILYGGEVVVRDRTSGPEVSFLFDVETAISANIGFGGNGNDIEGGGGGFDILRIRRENPLRVRYKAVGVRLGFTPPEERFQFRPVFDSSKGYTIDISGPGGIEVASPLDRVLQVLGARLSRTNPMSFEIDLGFSVDLGVVSVDRARVRLPLSPIGPPELTALAASIDIPAVLRAAGYLEIGSTFNEDGIEISEIRGGLDLTIVPIKLRIRAEMAIANIPESAGGPATGVVVAIEVTFPAPIPLGSSGLGLLGVLGLFAMHYGRNETPFASDATPALSWLNATGGEPTKLSEGDQHFWTPQIDRWAFGVGAVLGTMEGGVIFNLKGVFLLELPGPRILLMMKAALLTPPPAVKGLEEAGGSLLAVIDLDAGRGTLTIGIVASYEAAPLLKIRIPIEAFFHLTERGNWHIFIGKIDDPIQAKVISVFEGSGYLMISGNGLSSPKLTDIPSGLAIATGLHVELIWGNKEIRIYASIAGGFDAIMGFKPFFLDGLLYVRGELRLIIIGISAYAELGVRIGRDPVTDADIARLEGEICGKVDLFFFEIKGCVDFALGDNPPRPIPDLVERMSLVSRGPALVQGSGTDQPIDAVLAEAIMQDNAPGAGAFVEPSEAEEEDDRPRRVPIDVIMSISMAASPATDSATLLGGDFTEKVPGSTVDGFIDRAGQRVRYELEDVNLVEGEIGPGNRPAVWWTDEEATEPSALVQLALLTWTPNPTPAAVERSEFLEQTIIDRWGTICNDAAPAAPVLWAFHREPLGPSETGWRVEGTQWPDPPGTERSVETDTEIEVCESWRSGVPELDDWRGIYPAWIEGKLVFCKEKEEPTPPQTVPDFTLGDVELSPVFAEFRTPQKRIEAGMSVDFEALVASRHAAVDDLLVSRATTLPLRATNPRSAVFDGRVRAESLSRNTITADAPRELELAGAEPATMRAAPDPRIEEARVKASMDAFTLGQGRDRLVAERPTPVDAVRSFTFGETIERNAFLNAGGQVADFDSTSVPAAAPRRCESRVLACPILDRGDVVAMGDKTKADEIKAGWEEVGFEQSPLSNAIRIKSGGIVGGALLLGTFRVLVELEWIVIRILDPDGGELDRFRATQADLVPSKPLPERWTDDNGPWCRDVAHASRFLTGFPSHIDMRAVLVDLPAFPEAAEIEIGLAFPDEPGPDGGPDGLAANTGRGAAATAARNFAIPGLSRAAAAATTPGLQQLVRLFYVLCFELTRIGEATRETYDEQLIEDQRGAVGRYLGLESGDYALLEPDTQYGLRVQWRQELEIPPAEGETDPTIQSEQREETFWFHTTALPPARLGQYMLYSLPNERESHVFGEEPLKLVFSTPQVVNLFAAYGLQLQVRLRAASFRQPDPEDLPPGESYPFPLTPNEMELLPPIVLTPFEEALEDFLDGKCIEIAETRIRHLSRTIVSPLDPLTDYILDIETVPEADPENGPRTIVHSVPFTTGAFPTLDAFATELATVRENHRWVASGLLQAAMAPFASRAPEGSELDGAMMEAGLEPMPVPDRPRTTVFWEQAGQAAQPQPVAILVDSPEPMHRLWNLPTKLTDTDADPESTYWAPRPRVWLELENGQATPGMIDRVVMAPGGQRALVMLNPGARGQRVQLEMVRRALVAEQVDPPGAVDRRFAIVDLVLSRAPWEE